MGLGGYVLPHPCIFWFCSDGEVFLFQLARRRAVDWRGSAENCPSRLFQTYISAHGEILLRSGEDGQGVVSSTAKPDLDSAAHLLGVLAVQTTLFYCTGLKRYFVKALPV